MILNRRQKRSETGKTHRKAICLPALPCSLLLRPGRVSDFTDDCVERAFALGTGETEELLPHGLLSGFGNPSYLSGLHV